MQQIDVVDQAARALWDYLRLGGKPSRADVLMVFTSNDLRVAEYAAGLFCDKYAPLVIIGGGIAHKDDLLATGWGEPEAEVFARAMEQNGVPRSAIFLETCATHGGDNVLFSRRILNKQDVYPKSILLVQKPFMERRAYATFKQLWPEPALFVAAPPFSFDEWMAGPIPKETVINIMVGDLERIRDYPALGYQIAQNIPEKVVRAYETLLTHGFTKHQLIKDAVV